MIVVTIEIAKEGIKFRSTGEIGNGSVLLKPSGSMAIDDDNDDDSGDSSEKKQVREVKIDFRRPVAQQFAISYLTHICKASPLADRIHISMTEDIPCQIAFKLPNDSGSIRYWIAPKIGEEDEA